MTNLKTKGALTLAEMEDRFRDLGLRIAEEYNPLKRLGMIQERINLEQAIKDTYGPIHHTVEIVCEPWIGLDN